MKPTMLEARYLNNLTPDRPEIPFYCTRKSRSAADIFSAPFEEIVLVDASVKLRNDDAKSKISLLMKSNYDYTPRNGDELKLKRGSTIRVLRRDCDDGWWYGETEDGRKGFFPQNHVQLAPGRAEEIDSSELQFTGLLGSGGFCVVHSAIYKYRKVAVKVPHSKFSEKESQQAVKDEASIFQMLNHENIVKMYGIVTGATFGMVFELCCDSLSSICSSSKAVSLSEEIIAYWSIQIANGMKYLHDLNVIHRDLKAANVLVKEKVCECLLNSCPSSLEYSAHSSNCPDGFCYKCGGAALNQLTLKIADLGLSKRIQVVDSRMSVVGTIPYLAPEVIRDRICSKAMDVWSFGIVIWEVITGTVPFKGIGQGAVQLQIGAFVKQKIPSSCPADLKEIIECCWMDDPQERPTFKELVVKLRKFSEKFKSKDTIDGKPPESSMIALRKSMMEEMALMAEEIVKKASELQKREENLKKSEQELRLNQLVFELQQALSMEAPKEKPQPPKRRPHLKCSDISEPFDLKTTISLTKDMQILKPSYCEESEVLPNGIDINDNKNVNVTQKFVEGSATLPRMPKKQSLPCATRDREVNSENTPSKSQPDLMKLYRQRVGANSIPLRRSNACRIKRHLLDVDRNDSVDENCICIVSEADLNDSLMKEDSSTFSSLDHLATPRRRPANAKRSSRNADSGRPSNINSSGFKQVNEDEKRFFRNLFKLKDKSRSNHGSLSLPRPSTISVSPSTASESDSNLIAKSAIKSKHQPSSPTDNKSAARKIPMKTKKKMKKSSLVRDSKDVDDISSSSTSIKNNGGERQMSSVSSSASTLRNSIVSTVQHQADANSTNSHGSAVNLLLDESYEKISGISAEQSLLENPFYNRNVPAFRDCASASAISINAPNAFSRSLSTNQISDDCGNFSTLGVIENWSYKQPVDSTLRVPTAVSITLDSPVEGGIVTDQQITTDQSRTAEDHLCANRDNGLRHTCRCTFCLRSPSIAHQHPTLADEATHANIPSTSNIFRTFSRKESEIDHLELPSAPAPPPPLPPTYSPNITRPQRPYTLDLNIPVTPAESGISTASSSYQSFLGSDNIPQDHAPPPPPDYTYRVAPPIPPRSGVKRSEDETSARLKLSPVFQSP